ncbi:hypothetical protein [Zavarzinella formosa]|nr:hypothetical protein [Zavarzinella formosa]
MADDCFIGWFFPTESMTRDMNGTDLFNGYPVLTDQNYRSKCPASRTDRR